MVARAEFTLSMDSARVFSSLVLAMTLVRAMTSSVTVVVAATGVRRSAANATVETIFEKGVSRAR
jgi:hypothetical protein